jgi:hypothetical protein
MEKLAASMFSVASKATVDAVTTGVNVAAAGMSAAASAGNKVLSSEAQFFDETVTVSAPQRISGSSPSPSTPRRPQPDRIKHLLDNVELGSGRASMAEKTEGMKYILAVRSCTSVRGRACG